MSDQEDGAVSDVTSDVESDFDNRYRVKDTGSRDQNTVLLASVVENELLPKLVLAGKAAHQDEDDSKRAQGLIHGNDINMFMKLLLDGARGSCIAYVHDKHANGVSLESIYLDLLAPAAERLGPMWTNDELSFMEISIALARLQTLITKVARSETPSIKDTDPSRRIILARARQEQHAFGLLIVAEFFRLAGWHVSGGAELDTGPRLNSVLRGDSYSVLGLTAGSRRMALDLADDIKAARACSANRNLTVIVGGPAFVQEPDLLTEIGGDFSAVDGLEAVEKAEAFAA